MNEHEKISAMLPFYISGKLSEHEQQKVKGHIDHCDECIEELALWKDVSLVLERDYSKLRASPQVLNQTLEIIQEKEAETNLFSKTWQILISQVPLVKKEIWPASLLILLLGFVVTLIADKTVFIYALAPLVSVGGLAFIYGGENDPAHELVLSTPISQTQILLTRSILVFGYNILIMLILSWILSLFYSVNLVLPLILEWLAPMTFLSSLGLCIAIISNSEYAIFLSYFLWISKYLLFTPTLKNTFTHIGTIYLAFWQNTFVLYALSIILIIVLLTYVRISSRFIRRIT